MKIWIRSFFGDKTGISASAELPEITVSSITNTLRETLLPLDAPTPIVLPTHANHLKSFNIVRFRPSDFVESVDFDGMTVEIHKEKKEKQKFYY